MHSRLSGFSQSHRGTEDICADSWCLALWSALLTCPWPSLPYHSDPHSSRPGSGLWQEAILISGKCLFSIILNIFKPLVSVCSHTENSWQAPEPLLLPIPILYIEEDEAMRAFVPKVQGSHTTVTGWKETSICEMPILSDFASKYNTLTKMMTSTQLHSEYTLAKPMFQSNWKLHIYQKDTTSLHLHAV